MSGLFATPFRKACILLLWGVTGLSSGQGADILTVDFPISSLVEVSDDRLSAVPQQLINPDGSGYAQFPLLPLPEDRDLLVTVIFKEDGFSKGPALLWISTDKQTQATLSEDLAEGVQGTNQRTVQVSRDLLQNAGKLVLQGDQSKILRVRMDWVVLRSVYAATEQRPVSFILHDRFLQSTELTGEKTLSPPDIWVGKVLEASLQEGPESLAENLEFVVPLEEEVAQAIFTVKIMGLPLNDAVEIWINGTHAGYLQPAIPSLSDVGYIKDEAGKITYAGWRTAALHIPADLIKLGDNSIVVVAPPESQTFLRDASLQLRPAQEPTFVPDDEIVTNSL